MNNSNDNNKKINKFEVPIYTDLLDPKRKNAKVEGFSFDVDTFENLIDSFVPKENIPIILGVSWGDIERFCNKVYGLNFNETYNRLSGVTDYWCRKVFKNLAATGNQSAIKLVAEHFMGLASDNKNQGVNITIVNDLKGDGEDD